MSAYKDALTISSAEVGSRLQLACDLLTSGEAVVLLDGRLALRPERGFINCEVISSGSDAPDIQVREAKYLFRQSTLAGSISITSFRWLLVEDCGMGIVALWHES